MRREHIEDQNLKGILVLNKPEGMTSHDCINRVRKLARMKKVGHTGTLDPEVTGVLPICLGQATRVAEYLLDYDKEYVAAISIGRSTTTEDQTGETVEEIEISTAPSEEDVRQVLKSFEGEISQTPPMYSAVKVNGVPLYEYARKGQYIERQPRQVQIYKIELLKYTQEPSPVIKLKVRCSKGTYIRTLGVDIGKRLGFPAHLSSLVRSKSGPFTIEQTVTFDEIETWDIVQWRAMLRPMDEALDHFPKIELDPLLAERVINGQTLRLNQSVQPQQLYRVYNEKLQFFALCEGVGPSHIKPKKVFK